eukprot:scaffold217347_cov27-Tisochrysis_lutea.AAC.1
MACHSCGDSVGANDGPCERCVGLEGVAQNVGQNDQRTQVNLCSDTSHTHGKGCASNPHCAIKYIEEKSKPTLRLRQGVQQCPCSGSPRPTEPPHRPVPPRPGQSGLLDRGATPAPIGED